MDGQSFHKFSLYGELRMNPFLQGSKTFVKIDCSPLVKAEKKASEDQKLNFPQTQKRSKYFIFLPICAFENRSALKLAWNFLTERSKDICLIIPRKKKVRANRERNCFFNSIPLTARRRSEIFPILCKHIIQKIKTHQN